MSIYHTFVWGLLVWHVGLTGCSLRATRPEVRYYALFLTVPDAPEKPGTHSLIVRMFSARQPYDQERIVYRSSAYTFDRYNYHRWASPPGEQVTEWTRRSVRSSGIFAQVLPTTEGRADFILDGVVRQFEEIDHATHWEAALTIDFWLTRPGEHSPFWFQSYSAMRQTAKRNPEATVEAMSGCLQDVLTRLLADLRPLITTTQQP